MSILSATVAMACFVAMCFPDLRRARLASTAASASVENAAVWLKDRVRPGDLIVVKGAGWSPLTYYFRRHRVPVINRPAPCDAMSVLYTLPGAPAANTARGARRVLTIGTSLERPDTVLSVACLAWRPATAPRVVFESGRLRIHEGYVGPVTEFGTQRNTSHKTMHASGESY